MCNLRRMNFITPLRKKWREDREEWKELAPRTRFTLYMLIFACTMMIGSIFFQTFFQIPHEYNTDLTIHDEVNKSMLYNANILMKTSIFAVDNPIFVNATVKIINGSMPQNIYVLFDGSHSYPPEKRGFGNSLYGGKIDTKLQSNKLYNGNTTLYYDMDGCYDIKITAYPQLMNNQPFNQSRTCNLLHIQSSEAANTDFYDKYLVSLSLGSMAISFIAIISVFRDVLDDVRPKIKKQREEKKESPPDRKLD